MSKMAMLQEWGSVGDPFVHKRIFKGIAKLGKKIFKRGPQPVASIPGIPPGISGQVGGVIRRFPRGTAAAAGAAAAAAGAAGIAGVLGGAGGRRRRGRGITARELRGFRKVTNLLRKVGMVPKGLRGARKVCA